MTNMEVAYSEAPHDENIPIYANKKLEITGADGQCRKVIVTVQNYCSKYVEASVHCECNYFSKEKLAAGPESRHHIDEKVDALVDFSLWQLSRSGIEPTKELEAEIRSTIFEGLNNFGRGGQEKSGPIQKALSYPKDIF